MVPTAWLLLVLAAGSPGAAETESSEVRFTIVDRTDPDYEQAAVPSSARLHPEEERRLLLYHGERPVLDRGIRVLRSLTEERGRDGSGYLEEQGFVERAHISADARTAVVVASSYRLRRNTDTLGLLDPETDRTLGTESSLTWIDPGGHSRNWTVSFGEGRLVESVHPVESARGVAVTTVESEGENPDFRVYGPTGELEIFIDAFEATALEIRSVENGTFLGVDLGYSGRTGLPDRGILVLDLLRGGRWTYRYRYGSGREPVEWVLDGTGVLTVRTVDRHFQYDRFGNPLDGKRTGRRRRK